VAAPRRFLFLFGAVTAGLWLAPTGLVPIEHGFALQRARACSFCGKQAGGVRTLLGTCGGVPQICNECLLTCCDVVRDEMQTDEHRAAAHGSYAEIDTQRIADRYRIDDLLRQTAARDEARRLQIERMAQPEREEALLVRARHQAFVDEVFQSLVQPEQLSVTAPMDEFHCSFCGAARRQVARLISGSDPRAFICDACTRDAVAVLSDVLPA
jgi:hypothetical protein